MGFSIGGLIKSGVHALEDAGKKAIKGVVDGVVDKLENKVAGTVDKFEKVLYPVAQGVNAIAGLFGKRGSSADKVNDGKIVGANGQTFPGNTPLNDVAGVKPSNGQKPTEKIFYVNGINTNLADQQATMQTMADKTGAEVVGIHNATEGAISDLKQSAGDKINKGNNPAVDTLADGVYGELKAGRPVHLMAHSQGAIITSRALTDVKNRLMIEDGMTKEQAEKALSNVKVETFGGAASKYPDGPQYVHYVNRGDLVPGLLGLGKDRGEPGKGAKVIVFDDFHLNPVKSHSIDETYLNHRVPFDQARA